ncbi:MAG TPA: hypothetical protein VHZ03_14195 [Trebonia sp.]|jgi:hypothetical protein|nr:hypothetical protein [Trebonia sp.]
MTAEAAARVSKERGRRGVGVTYWRNVEKGTGGRRSERVTVRASDEALADMALVVGVEPGQLADAGREGAAQLLAEIQRREGLNQPAAPATGPGTDWLPVLQADEEQIGSWERRVWSEVADALAKYGEHATGEQVFPDRPRTEQLAWDTPDFRSPLDTDEREVRARRVRFIAKLRMVLDHSAQSQQTG